MKRARKKSAKKKSARKKSAKKKVAKKSVKRRPRKVARKAPKRRPKRRPPAKPHGRRKPHKPHKPKPHRPHKPKPTVVAPVQHEIQLIDPTGPDSAPILSKSRGDMVRWVNTDNIDHTLSFGLWPFQEAKTSILVPAGTTSSWFTVSPTATVRSYSYGIDPPFSMQGPPDPPVLDTGP